MRSLRCSPSTRISPRSPVVTGSGSGPMSGLPGRSLATRRIWARWMRRACGKSRTSARRSPRRSRSTCAPAPSASLRNCGPRSRPGCGGSPRYPASAPNGPWRCIPISASTRWTGSRRLSVVTGCERCTYAGSLRRMKDTIGDIDILAISGQPSALMDAVKELPHVTRVVASGPTKTTIATTTGLQVDLRVVPPDSWGAALQYFTGSREHNIRTREIAVHAKLKLSEYGLFDVETGDKIVSATEEEVYERLGLPWIPPTLREDSGEIDAARRGELPDLVTVNDLRGDLHTHTDLTDGTASLEAMVAGAAARGYSYYAVTDHAPNLFMLRMTIEKMLAQREQVRGMDGKHAGMTLLHGTELNIDPDGEVDWPAEILREFDLTVASVHSHFTQSRAEMTRRLIRAVENPWVSILGHPSGRKIGKRPPVDADWDAVYAACARTGTAVEIDAFPDRLDASDEHIKIAHRHGAVFSIDSDAHAIGHLAHMRYGVGTAQRGWLTPADVINTWPLPRLRAFLRPT